MELKELYHIAKGELSQIIDTENPDFRLEEAVYDEASECWEIVVSFLLENTNKPNSPLGAFGNTLPFERVYKKLKINKQKEVEAILIHIEKV